MRWTPDQLAEYQARSGRAEAPKVGKPSKYRNQRVVTEDGTFDSKWELACWTRLKIEERAGLITGLQRQVPFKLIPAAKLDSRQLPAVKYVADFVYYRNGERVVEDAKGMKSLPDFKLKRRLMWWLHKVRVVEVRKGPGK